MPQSDSYAEDVAKLRDIAREFTKGFNSGDVERIMRFYGDKYVDVNLRRPVQSKAERSVYYRRVIQNRGIQIEVVPDEMWVEGNLGFVRGTINIARTAPKPGETPSTELRYLEIMRKDSEGNWKAVWGMDGPIQEYDPAD